MVKNWPRRTKKDPVRLSKLRQTSQAAFAASSFSSWLLLLTFDNSDNFAVWGTEIRDIDTGMYLLGPKLTWHRRKVVNLQVINIWQHLQQPPFVVRDSHRPPLLPPPRTSTRLHARFCHYLQNPRRKVPFLSWPSRSKLLNITLSSCCKVVLK